MIEVVMLDSGPLGMLAHPRPNTKANEWLKRVAESGARIVIPEIADYEVRRELVRAGKTKGLRRLDRMKMTWGYLPIDTATMLQAAEFWAEARRSGKPTAPDTSLDADVILAAQAKMMTVAGFHVTVATNNVDHLSRFVTALRLEQFQ